MANVCIRKQSTISLGSHQNIGLHTGARANVVLLTYLLTSQTYGGVGNSVCYEITSDFFILFFRHKHNKIIIIYKQLVDI